MVAAALLAGGHTAGGFPQGDLVSHAVTIEGTASIRVTADTCRAAFMVTAMGDSAEQAAEAMKEKRKRFETAVRTVIGSDGDIELAPMKIERLKTEKAQPYQALQTAAVVYTKFPKGSDEFNENMAAITSAVAAAGVTPQGFKGPEVVFEIERFSSLEDRLATLAVEDAKTRAKLAGRIMGRKLGEIISGSFSAGVFVNGTFAPFVNPSVPIVTDEIQVQVIYIVQIAFELET